MNNPRIWGIPLLVWHFLVLCLWVYLFSPNAQPTEWMVYTAIWTLYSIQFTWGLTVGLIVGPGRATRGQLWWSALFSLLPISILTMNMLYAIVYGFPIGWAILFFVTSLVILACETFCGVLLGAKAYLWIKGLGNGE